MWRTGRLAGSGLLSRLHVLAVGKPSHDGKKSSDIMLPRLPIDHDHHLVVPSQTTYRHDKALNVDQSYTLLIETMGFDRLHSHIKTSLYTLSRSEWVVLLYTIGYQYKWSALSERVHNRSSFLSEKLWIIEAWRLVAMASCCYSMSPSLCSCTLLSKVWSLTPDQAAAQHLSAPRPHSLILGMQLFLQHKRSKRSVYFPSLVAMVETEHLNSHHNRTMGQNWDNSTLYTVRKYLAMSKLN